MTLFDRVKELADEQKISIAELERKLTWSTNVLYKLKTQKPSIDRVEALADYFNVSTDYLLGRTNKKNWEFIEDNEQENSAEIVDIVGKIKELSPEQIKNFLEVIYPILRIIKK